MDGESLSSPPSERSVNRIPWPKTGPITVLVLVPLLDHLLTIAMPIMVEDFGPVFPDLVPRPFRTVVTVLFWLVVGVTFVILAVRRWVRYSEEYESRGDLETNLEGDLPSPYQYAGYVAAVLGGTALALWSYDPFATTFEAFVDMFVIQVGNVSFGAGPVVVLQAFVFVAGVGLACNALDRLTIGVVRLVFLRVYSPQSERSNVGTASGGPGDP